uniref:Uncharacterized protein n=1 Tax=Anopheles merus TaxID=30066 RepID=A0A182VCL9_ANOME
MRLLPFGAVDITSWCSTGCEWNSCRSIGDGRSVVAAPTSVVRMRDRCIHRKSCAMIRRTASSTCTEYCFGSMSLPSERRGSELNPTTGKEGAGPAGRQQKRPVAPDRYDQVGPLQRVLVDGDPVHHLHLDAVLLERSHHLPLDVLVQVVVVLERIVVGAPVADLLLQTLVAQLLLADLFKLEPGQLRHDEHAAQLFPRAATELAALLLLRFQGMLERGVVVESCKRKRALPNKLHYYMVSSMIAFTMSFSLFLSARMAFARFTFAWDMTRSMSLSSMPVSSTSSSSSSAIGVTTFVELDASPAAGVASGALNFSAAATCACWVRSSILASPKMM